MAGRAASLSGSAPIGISARAIQASIFLHQLCITDTVNVPWRRYRLRCSTSTIIDVEQRSFDRRQRVARRADRESVRFHRGVHVSRPVLDENYRNPDLLAACPEPIAVDRRQRVRRPESGFEAFA
jgi:hypothetical protein